MAIDQNKVRALMKREFQFLIDNPDMIDKEVEFFLNGGFFAYSEDQIDQKFSEDIQDAI